MSLGSFRHFMVYVSDFPRSKEFYDAVLDFMGYTLAHSSETYGMWNPSQEGCSFGLVQSPSDLSGISHQRGTPGFHHLAFNATSRDQINDLYGDVLLAIGAPILDPPGACPEYGPTYYAIYFEDPDGMKLEVAHS